MKINNLKSKLLIILVLLSFVIQSISAQISATEVMEKVNELQNKKSAALDIILTLIDTNGDIKERRIQTLSRSINGNNESITIFLSPLSVKQTRFLLLEKDGYDDLWIYLPALRQSKKISSRELSSSFMGSDFSYADMSATTYKVDEAKHTLIDTQTLNNREVYVIQSILNDSSIYEKSIVYVDTNTYIPMKVLLYDKSSSLLKILETKKIELLDGEWSATIMEMSNVNTSHKTRIEIINAKYNLDIPSKYFTLQFLNTGRI